MKAFSKETVSIADTCNGLLFIGLNVVDAWLTRQLMAIGGVEANWWPEPYNGNMLIKGAAALAVVLILIWVRKGKLLWLLNVGISIVVLSNAVCFLTYLGSLYGWFP